MSSLVGPDEDDPRGRPPVPEDVQEAVRTLIRWAGDDPEREGLRDTPQRVARAWKEYCQGYDEDPASHLSRMFEEVGGYDEILRIGSANFNNRSLRLDGECDVFIDCARPGNADACAAIRALRHSLLAEHCGIDEEEVGPLLERTGSMAGMIAALGDGHTRYLRPFHPPELSEVEAALADRETFDPEEPAEMFQIVPPGRGLFRPGSLLARAMNRVNRKRRAR